MQQRKIGPFNVTAIGLGCMNLSHAYGVPPSPEAAERVLLRALDLGITLFDTAALYGFGANETLVGRVLSSQRSRFVLASKCGMHGLDGKRIIDGRPDTIKWSCEESLKRLKTDVIDIFYLHRWDKKVPIEDSVGAMADLVRAGKVKAIGLSEVSAQTLLKAHAVHPIAAVQTEYSLWSRNAEIAVLKTSQQIGAAFVAFSPVARGFLGGKLRDVATLEAKDIRRAMPRFYPENYPANLALLERYSAIAHEVGCTPAQLALAWLLTRGEHVIPIPGTTRIEHLEENRGALNIQLSPEVTGRLDALINQNTVTGPRYNPTNQVEIDTEEF
jgi:aryl-alcohol dehydrogenase-like predicted oxidoreductase